jgi:two-component system chemotaxis response regulator CheB
MACGRTRILISDDSAVMRSLLRAVVTSDAGLEVAGTAADGEAALGAIETLRPDLVLLDVEMPVMDGLMTLKKLRARGYRMPVIMCSSLTQRGAKVTIEALASGASDYVAKPAGQAGREAAMQTLTQDLIPKIQALTNRPQPVLPGAARIPLLAPMAPFKAQPVDSIPTALIIGVSTGGPAALDILLPSLPANFPLPVLIVQHMPELFTKLFAERLNARCPLQVREAVEGEPVRAGSIYIAKGNWHMEVLPGVPAGKPLPSRRRCALPLSGRGLRRGRAGCGAHRHGFGRHVGRALHSRAWRQRARSGPGLERRVGNARRRSPRGIGAQGAAPQRHRR